MLINRWTLAGVTLILAGTYWVADGSQRLDPTACRNGLGSANLPDRTTYFYTAPTWRRWPTSEPTFATPEPISTPTPAPSTPSPTPRTPTSPPGGTQGPTPRVETPSTPNLPEPNMPIPGVPSTPGIDLPFSDPTRPNIPPQATEEMRRELDLDPAPRPPLEGQSPLPIPDPVVPANPTPNPTPGELPPPPPPSEPPRNNFDDLFETPRPRTDSAPSPPREGGGPTSRNSSPFEDDIFQDEHKTGNPFGDEPEPRTSGAPDRPRQSSNSRSRDLQKDDGQPPAKWRIIADSPSEFPSDRPETRSGASRQPLLPVPSQAPAETRSGEVTFSSANPLRSASNNAAKSQRVTPAANWSAEPRPATSGAASRAKNPLR